MPRVTNTELRVLVDGKASEDFMPFAEDAHTLVEETLGPSPYQGLSDARLKLIEKYLAAHLWVLSAEKGGLLSERIGDALNMYVNSSSTNQMGLASTRFGRMVISQDTTGKLNLLLSSSKKAQFRVV